MKEGWEYKKLGEVCEKITDGSHNPPKSGEYSEFLMLSSKNIFNRELTFDEPRYLTKGQFEIEDKRTGLKAGDVLLTIVGTIGRCCVVKDNVGNIVFQRSVAVLKPNAQIINSDFLMYQMIGSTQKLNNEAKGIAQKGVYIKQLEKFVVIVPPLSEQQAIVEELDLLNAIIDKKKEELEELDKLAQSIFYDMFGDPVENEKGWEAKNVKDVAKVKIGPFGSLLHVEDYVENGYPVINPIHMSCGKILPDMDFTIDDEKYSEMSVYVLKENDVVFGRRGDIGRCALVTSKESGYICGTGSLYVRFDIDINPLYSLAMFQHDSLKKYLISKAKGATMLNINCGVVEQMPIILPPLPLQQQFATRISAIEQMKEKVSASMAEVQTLLAATMDKYFG